MLLTSLVENTTHVPQVTARHGLSLWIETRGKNILFDLGPTGPLPRNAEVLGVDLRRADFAVLSHGHSDHGGALRQFLAINATAPVVVQEHAFEPYYVRVAGLPFPVGLDKKLQKAPQVRPAAGITKLADGITLFDDVPLTRLCPEATTKLLMKTREGLVKDTFRHEQHLLLEEDGKAVVIAGCAHSGIVNIRDKATAILGRPPEVMVAGMHMYNPATKKAESDSFVQAVAEALRETETLYYTCHCTGVPVYEKLRQTLGEQIHYLSAGEKITL